MLSSMIARAMLLAAGVVCCGCGGRRVEALDDASAADAAATMDVAVSPPKDAVADRQPTTCEELSRELDAAREALANCCLGCDMPQCNGALEDLCCSISYTAWRWDGPNGRTNAATAKRFAELVRRLNAECPPVTCPPGVCADTPSFTCAANGRCVAP